MPQLMQDDPAYRYTDNLYSTRSITLTQYQVDILFGRVNGTSSEFAHNSGIAWYRYGIRANDFTTIFADSSPPVAGVTQFDGIEINDNKTNYNFLNEWLNFNC